MDAAFRLGMLCVVFGRVGGGMNGSSSEILGDAGCDDLVDFEKIFRRDKACCGILWSRIAYREEI